MLRLRDLTEKICIFEVQRPKDKFTALCDILDRHKSQKCDSLLLDKRKTVEEVCERLNDNGYDATKVSRRT